MFSWRELDGLTGWKTGSLSQLVFVDGSVAKTHMAPLYDWSLKGICCHGKASCNWNTITMLSSISLDCKSEGVIFNGGSRKAIFRKYIEDVLLPGLNPGDIIIMDNLRA